MLTKERMGEIALLHLKNKLRNEGIRLKPDMKRQIGNEAKELGISVEEAMQFAEMFVRGMVEEVFPPHSFTAVNPDHNREM